MKICCHISVTEPLVIIMMVKHIFDSLNLLFLFLIYFTSLFSVCIFFLTFFLLSFFFKYFIPSPRFFFLFTKYGIYQQKIRFEKIILDLSFYVFSLNSVRTQEPEFDPEPDREFDHCTCSDFQQRFKIQSPRMYNDIISKFAHA